MRAKTNIIITTLSIAAIGIIAAIIIVLINQSKTSTAPTDPSGLSYPTPSPDYSSESSQKLIFNESTSGKSFDEFVAICEEQIALAPTPEDRANIYLVAAAQLATFYSEGHGQIILEYAHNAEEISPSIASANALVAYEYSYGDVAASEKYSEILKERSADDPDYQQEIERLNDSTEESKNS